MELTFEVIQFLPHSPVVHTNAINNNTSNLQVFPSDLAHFKFGNNRRKRIRSMDGTHRNAICVTLNRTDVISGQSVDVRIKFPMLLANVRESISDVYRGPGIVGFDCRGWLAKHLTSLDTILHDIPCTLTQQDIKCLSIFVYIFLSIHKLSQDDETTIWFTIKYTKSFFDVS